ncbi:MAG: hypothetical protein U1E93_11855 [Alphaproteobacteria bacterium]
MSTHADIKAHEKMPEHHSTDKTPKTKEEKIDAQMEDSFPASDPPSFSGGNHIIGAPTGRESEAPSPDAPAVVEAEKKVKEGKTKTPDAY